MLNNLSILHFYRNCKAYWVILVLFTTNCEKAAFHQRNAVVVLSQKLLGQIGTGLGILAVVIGTDVAGIVRCKNGTAYHDLTV